MKELTATQKESITLIEQQYVKMNMGDSNKSFGILNINELSAEVKRVNLGNTELAIHNSNMHKALKEIMIDAHAKLVVDLKNAGLESLRAVLSTPASDNYYGNIEIQSIHECFGGKINGYAVEIHPSFVSEETEFGYKRTAIQFADKSYEAQKYYPTIEHMLASAEINAKIVRLVRESNAIHNSKTVKA
jgi:hypothetical protein